MLHTGLLRSSLTPLSVALLCGLSVADVAILGPVHRNFTTIQAAVDVASDGDILLVGAGSYPGFVIDGKGLSILAAPPGVSVQITEPIQVSNLIGQDVLLVGMKANSTSGSPISVTNCTGQVRFQDCEFIGSGLAIAQPGAFLTNADAVFTNCTFKGNQAPTKFYTIPGAGHQGGDGLLLVDSRAALHDCTATGGLGGSTYHPSTPEAGNGGAGIALKGNSLVFLEKSNFKGGNGGDSFDCASFYYYCIYGQGGDGGAGVLLMDPNTQGYSLFSFGYGGSGGILSGSSGQGVSSAGSYTVVPGLPRKYSTPTIISDRQPASFTMAGRFKDKVFLRFSPLSSFSFSLPQGVWTLWRDGLSFPGYGPIGLVNAAGLFGGQIQLPVLSQNSIGRRYFLQGYVVDTHGLVHYGTPMSLLSLNDDSLPDCNHNGIQDYWEVIQGLVSDTNRNFVPDECEF
jgi:hypothetical protein